MKPLEYALRLLTRRSYHSIELIKKLKEKGFFEADQVVASLKSMGYLDDTDWENRFLELFLKKGYGPHLVFPTLQRKGLEILAPKFKDRVIKQERKILKDLVKPTSSYPEKKKLIARLVRRGFSLEAVIEATKEGDMLE